MKTAIFTSDKNNWLLKGFFHQWGKYCPDPKYFDIEVVGFEKPEGLPSSVKFVSLGDMRDYPVKKWSNGVIKYLRQLQDDLVTIFLEDYWLIRNMHVNSIKEAEELMMKYPDIIRFDLTTDRVFNKDSKFCGHYKGLDICRAKSDYAISFQASIYRRSLLLEILRLDETPWESEINGTGRVQQTTYDVLGSYQWPVNYMITVNKGRFDAIGDWMFPARSLSQNDWQELDSLGFIPKKMQNKESS